MRILHVLLVALLALLFAETQPGGLYKVGDRLVDANGNPVKRARKAADAKGSDEDDADNQPSDADSQKAS